MKHASSLEVKKVKELIAEINSLIDGVEIEQEQAKLISVKYTISHPWGTGCIQFTHAKNLTEIEVKSHIADILHEVDAKSIFITTMENK